jgi:hypothetical protein
VPTIFLKRESVNIKTRAHARQPDATASIGERHDKKKSVLPFFRQTKWQRGFRCSATMRMTFDPASVRHDAKHDGRRVGEPSTFTDA